MKRIARAILQFGDWADQVHKEGPVELLIVRGVAVPMIETFRKMAHVRYPDLSERKAELRWAARVGRKFMEKNVGELRQRAENDGLIRKIREREQAEALARLQAEFGDEVGKETA